MDILTKILVVAVSSAFAAWFILSILERRMRKMARRQNIERIKREMMTLMDRNGWYLLPQSFPAETYDTALHQAFHQLWSEGLIEVGGYENGYTKWVRTDVSTPVG